MKGPRGSQLLRGIAKLAVAADIVQRDVRKVKMRGLGARGGIADISWCRVMPPELTMVRVGIWLTGWFLAKGWPITPSSIFIARS